LRTVFVVLAACCLAASACSSAAPKTPGNPLDHLAVATTFHTYHVPSSAGLLSSIVDVGGGQYIACDPSNIYLLARNSNGYTIKTLGKPSVPKWNPVGLAYRDGLLYVANGSGRDVLTLRLNGTSLSVVGRITNPDLRDAENVVSEPNGSIAVTDQVNGSVLLFQADGTVRWRLKLTEAHGLAESGGNLYASSLADGGIREIDQSGKVIRTAGGIGVSSGRYVWPSGLAATPSGGIVVTDAHNGHISLLRSDLSVVGGAGGNGQGLDAFNYPSGTLPIADGYLVLDNFKYRIVHTDQRWTMVDQIALGPVVPTGRQRALVYGSDAHPNTYAMLPGVDLPGALGLRRSETFVGGLNGLDHVGPGGSLAHVDVTDPQLGTTSVTWAQRTGQYIVVGTSQGSWVEVIDPTTGMYTFVQVGHDSWWRSGQLLLSENLRRSLTDVIAPAVAEFGQAKQLLASGKPRAQAFNDALAAGHPRNWSQDLSSAAGQQFLRSPMTPADAARFYSAYLSQPQQRLVELLDVKYLSGA
jgi:DNA-binding beta-propeller fold protein YncE